MCRERRESLGKRNVFSLDLKTATESLLRTVFGREFQTAELCAINNICMVSILISLMLQFVLMDMASYTQLCFKWVFVTSVSTLGLFSVLGVGNFPVANFLNFIQCLHAVCRLVVKAPFFRNMFWKCLEFDSCLEKSCLQKLDIVYFTFGASSVIWLSSSRLGFICSLSTFGDLILTMKIWFKRTPLDLRFDFFLIWDFCNSIFKKPIPIMTFAYLGKTECMNHRSDLMPKLHHTNWMIDIVSKYCDCMKYMMCD